MIKKKQLHLEYGLPAKGGGAHEDHTHTGHSSGGGIIHVVHLKHKLAGWGHGDTVTISQCQCFVIIQHRVEVLNPYGIHRAIQYNPYKLP